jgi:hypothetical protein
MKGYTTNEQSKQLVSVGLDPNTADMCYKELISGGKVYANPNEAVLTPYSRALEYKQRLEDERAAANMEVIAGTVYEVTPCWSLNALIELFPKDKNAPVFTLTRCGKDPMTGKHNDEWYAEWETFETYIVLHNKNAVDAVVELIVKLINDKRIKL